MDNIHTKRTNYSITRELLRRFSWIKEEIEGLEEEIKMLESNRPFLEASFLKKACVQSGYINKLEVEIEQNEYNVEDIQKKINVLRSLKYDINNIFYTLSNIKKRIVKLKYYNIDTRYTNYMIARELKYSKTAILKIDHDIVQDFKSINKYRNILYINNPKKKDGEQVGNNKEENTNKNQKYAAK
jgi:hypothetical protein